MSLYLDTSAIVPLFVEDRHTADAEALLAVVETPPILSDFAAAELASALGRRVRMRELDVAAARAALTSFDSWAIDIQRTQVAPADVAYADSALRRLDLPLRLPDAINIAIAARFGATLATFDRQMAENAMALGISVAR